MSLFAPFFLTLLPTPITHQVLPHLSAYLPYIFPPSPRGSPIYQRNFKHVFTLIIAGYIVWSFGWGGADSGEPQAGGDWYALLGVGKSAGDEELKRAFRTLSRTYHPDRAGPAAGQHFILIRQAYEGLSDPIKRWAYDRFGPDILQWKAVTVMEYMRQGISQSGGFYIVSGGIMLLLSLLGRAKDGAFWRNLLFALLLITELHLILVGNPSLSSHPGNLLPTRVLGILTGDRPPFMQIRLLHRIFASLSVGISQLAGIWTGDGQQGRQPQLEDIFAAVRGLETEAIAGFHDTVAPLLSHGDPLHTEAVMKRGMEEALVDRAISTHPQIRPLWIDTLRRAEEKRPPTAKSAPVPAPYPPAKQSVPAMYVDQSSLARDKRVLGVAAGIPLPPSPPSSPILGPRR